MLSFIQYITEIGDSHYPFEKDMDGSVTASYKFNDHNEQKFHVRADKDTLGTHSHIYFRNDMENKSGFVGRIDKTGTNPKNAHRVFSTVHAIMKHHAKNNPGLTHFNFSSEKDYYDSNDVKATNRTKLYALYAKKLGGTTEEEEYGATHTIPVSSLKINEKFIIERKASVPDLGHRTASIYGRKIGDRTRIPLSSFNSLKISDMLRKLNKVTKDLHAKGEYSSNYETQKTLPISSLKATQSGVDMEDRGIISSKVKEHRNIDTITHKGEHYIMDGHHHIIAKKLRGDKHIEVDNLDLDKFE